MIFEVFKLKCRLLLGNTQRLCAVLLIWKLETKAYFARIHPAILATTSFSNPLNP